MRVREKIGGSGRHEERKMRLSRRQIAVVMSAVGLLLDVCLMFKSYVESGYVTAYTKQLGLGLMFVLIVNLYLARKERPVSK